MNLSFTRCAAAALVSAIAATDVSAQTNPMFPLLTNTNGAWAALGCYNNSTSGGWRCNADLSLLGTKTIDQNGNVHYALTNADSDVYAYGEGGRAVGIYVGSNAAMAVAEIGAGFTSRFYQVGDQNGTATFAQLRAYYLTQIPPEFHSQALQNFAAIEAGAVSRGLIDPQGRITIDNFIRVGMSHGIADDLRMTAVNGRVTVAEFMYSLPPGVSQSVRDRLTTQLRADAAGTVPVDRAVNLLSNFWYARREYDVAQSMAEVKAYGTDSRGIHVYSRRAAAQLFNQASVYAEGLRVNGLRASAGEPAANGQPVFHGYSADVVNSGSVTVRGIEARAITAGALTGMASVVNSGAVTADGDRSRGISVGTSPAAPGAASGAARAENSGLITTIGHSTTGIRVVSEGGGAATVENTGDLKIGTTGGQWAGGTGIFVSSLGGGPVRLETSGLITVGAENGKGVVATVASGSNGPHSNIVIAVKSGGAINMRGPGSVAVVADSMAGGFVDVTIDGRVAATGVSSAGIIAASSQNGGNGFGTISVNIGVDGVVRGGAVDPAVNYGPSPPAGIILAGGGQRVVNNNGVINALGGVAISGMVGQATNTADAPVNYVGTLTNIYNFGVIKGSVLLNGGPTTVWNYGYFQLGERIELGPQGGIMNAGTVTIGATWETSVTRMIGNFHLAPKGRLRVDIDGVSTELRSDRLEITGGAAIEGMIMPRLISGPNGVGDQFTVIQTTQGVFLSPTARVSETAGFKFTPSVVNNGKDLALTTTRVGTIEQIVAVPGYPGVQQTAQRLAALETIVQSGAVERTSSAYGRFQQLTDAIRLEPDANTASQAARRLDPQSSAAAQQSAQRSAGAFANAMMSCASQGGEGKFAKEEQCLYATAKYRDLDRDATAATTGGRETSQEFMAGAQIRLQGEWRLGIALGHEQVTARLDDGTQQLGTTEGGRLVGGLVLKNQWGPWNAYLSVVGSHGSFDHNRFVNVGGLASTAIGEQSISSVALKGRLAYTMDYGSWYARPMVDVGVTRTGLSGYTETGAGAANLAVNSTHVWQAAITPAIEFGGQVQMGPSAILRPYVRAGATFLSGSSLIVTGNFADAPAGLAPFTLSEKSDRSFFVGEIGAQMLFGDVGLKLNYEGTVGRHTEQHALGAKLTINY